MQKYILWIIAGIGAIFLFNRSKEKTGNGVLSGIDYNGKNDPRKNIILQADRRGIEEYISGVASLSEDPGNLPEWVYMDYAQYPAKSSNGLKKVFQDVDERMRVVIDQINNSDSWLSSIEKKALEFGNTTQEMIVYDAAYMVSKTPVHESMKTSVGDDRNLYSENFIDSYLKSKYKLNKYIR